MPGLMAEEGRVPVSRTIITGLGGTGVRAALYTKCELINHFSEVPAVVKITCFDTDSKFDSFTDLHGGTVALDRDEFMHLAVPSPQITLQALANLGQNEFPQGRVRVRALTDGASQVRALGRLSILANVDQITGRLNTLLGAVLAQAAEDNIRASERLELYDDRAGVQGLKPVTVYVICSMAGGMGSGSFIDIAYLWRQLFAQTQHPEAHKIIGIFLLPPIFENRPATAHIYGNGYAALMELDYLMSRQVGQGDADTVVYTSTMTVPWHQLIPFDQVYLVDNWNESGNREDDLERLYRLISQTLFLNVSVTAESVRANIRGGAQLPDWDGKQALYAGFGIANVEIPIDLTIEETAALTMLDFLDNYLLRSEKEEYAELAAEFVDIEKIDENPRDDVIDYLIDKAENADLKDLQDSRGHLAVHRYKDSAARIKMWMTNQRNKGTDKNTGYSQRASAKMMALLNKLRSHTDDAVKAMIIGKGILRTRLFLNALRGRLEYSRDMMATEAANYDPSSVKYPEDKDIENACSAFWKKPSVENLVNTIKVDIDAELQLSFQKTRREYAQQFFRELLKHVDGWEQRVKAVRTNITAATTSINRNIHNIRDAIAKEKFNLLLSYNDLKPDISVLLESAGMNNELIMGQLNAETILGWGEQEGGQKIIQDINAIIAERISKALRWDGQNGLKIDQVLTRMYPDAEQLNRALEQKLIQKVSPWWRYNAALATGRQLFSVLIFGTKFANDSILQQVNLQRLGIQPGAFDVTSTGDPYRLTALKYRFSVPAYAIGSVEPMAGGVSYASRYKALEGPGFTHHIRDKWLGGQNLQPLSPSLEGGVGVKGTDETKEYWSVGFAQPFDIIRFDPLERYYMVSKGAGKAKERRIFLGKERLDAYGKFCHQPDWLSEVKNRVLEVVREKGADAVVDALTRYVESVETSIEKDEFPQDAVSFHRERGTRSHQWICGQVAKEGIAIAGEKTTLVIPKVSLANRPQSVCASSSPGGFAKPG